MNTCRGIIKDMFTFSRERFWRMWAELLFACSRYFQSPKSFQRCSVWAVATSHQLALIYNEGTWGSWILQTTVGRKQKVSGWAEGGYYTMRTLMWPKQKTICSLSRGRGALACDIHDGTRVHMCCGSIHKCFVVLLVIRYEHISASCDTVNWSLSCGLNATTISDLFRQTRLTEIIFLIQPLILIRSSADSGISCNSKKHSRGPGPSAPRLENGGK